MCSSLGCLWSSEWVVKCSFLVRLQKFRTELCHWLAVWPQVNLNCLSRKWKKKSTYLLGLLWILSKIFKDFNTVSAPSSRLKLIHVIYYFCQGGLEKTQKVIYSKFFFFILTQGHFLLLLEREEGGKREGEKHQSVSSCMCPEWRTEPRAWAWVLMGNQTWDLLVYGTMLWPAKPHWPEI